MPPVTLYQCWMPWRLSALITVLERSPPAQSTAFGRSSGTRSRRVRDSIIGRWRAPSMWPSSHATRSANCGLSIHTLIAPGTWPSPYAPGSRRSTTHSPRRTASHASRAVYGRGFAAWSGISPRFLPTIFSNWGGFGGRSRMMNSTNAARSRSCNAGLKRRSKPIVEPAFADIARPHVERVAVAQPLVVEGEPGRRVGEDRRARRGGEVTVARDVIGVRVRLDDVRDREAAAPGQSQIFVDAVAPGIDDDGPPGLAAADQ